MFWSAVSFLAGFAQPASLTIAEVGPWKRIEPAFVTLMRDRTPVGMAVCIHRRGLFVAPQQAVSSSRLEGRMTNGSVITLTIAGRDATTRLVLLESVPAGDFPLAVSAGQPWAGSMRVFAVGPAGPVRAEIAATVRMAVFGGMLIQAQEVRFEATTRSIGGALLVSSTGQLMGVVNATLPASQSMLNFESADASRSVALNQYANVGPASMTVGYTPSASMVRRSVEVFLRSGQSVSQPFIGVFCLRATGGALVQTLVANGPAAKAGVMTGDVIEQIGDQTIRDQIEFSQVMQRQPIGARIVLTIRRGTDRIRLSVVVAAAPGL